MAQEMSSKDQEMLQKKLADSRKAKNAARREAGDAGLTMNSMMDMMTIILVFLLKSYGEEPVRVLPDTDIPISTALVTPDDMTVVSVTRTGVFLIDKKVVDLEEGLISANFKKGGEGGLIIEPLENALREEVEKQKNFARMTNSEFQGDMTIVADQSTAYRVLAEVMQTAISTEFKKFRFAVIQGNLKNSGLYSGKTKDD